MRSDVRRCDYGKGGCGADFGTRAVWCRVFMGTAQTTILATAIRGIASVVGIAKVLTGNENRCALEIRVTYCAWPVEIANTVWQERMSLAVAREEH